MTPRDGGDGRGVMGATVIQMCDSTLCTEEAVGRVTVTNRFGERRSCHACAKHLAKIQDAADKSPGCTVAVEARP